MTKHPCQRLDCEDASGFVTFLPCAVSRTGTCGDIGNRKLADYQFNVGQDISINQRNHHRYQLGPVGPLTAKAVGPFKIKKQITENTFEIDIHETIRKKMRSVLHAGELIPFETRDVDPVGALPPRDRADDPNIL